MKKLTILAYLYAQDMNFRVNGQACPSDNLCYPDMPVQADPASGASLPLEKAMLGTGG